MKRNVLTFINKLQSYKTAIKNLHWSAKNMSEHKLWDEIADTVADTQDEVAEIAQGIFGNIKLNELKPRRYNITNSKKTLIDITRDTKLFYATIKRGETFVGIRSVVESFIAELEKYQYLMNFCIKEDIKRNLKSSLNESKQTNNTKIKLTEQELRSLIKEAINNVLNEDFKQDEIDASWDAYEKTRQPLSRYRDNNTLETYLDDENDWYKFGKDNYDEVMDDENGYQDKLDDFLDDYHQFSKEDDGFNAMQAQRTDYPEFYKRVYQDKFSKPQRKLEKYR